MNAQSENLQGISQNINENEYSVLDDRYIILKTIGSGATSKVKLGKDKNNDEVVAVKILKPLLGKIASSQIKEFSHEVEMLKQIKHPNIINLLEGNRGLLVKPNGKACLVDYIVLEYAANGNMFDYIFFPREGLGEQVAKYFFGQLLEGVDACHKAGIAHRDLKTENLMLSQDYSLKIADFGFATPLSGKKNTGLLNTYLGTVMYSAPEILTKKPYEGASADIFSIGVILFILVTGKIPFGKSMPSDQFYKFFVRGTPNDYWKVMSSKILKVSEEFKTLFNSIVSFNPKERPALEEIKAHSWMISEELSKEEIETEFNRRKRIVIEMKELEFQESQSMKQQKKLYGNVAKYRNADVNDQYFISETECKMFIDNGNPYRIKFKGKNSTYILNQLCYYFSIEDTRSKEIMLNDMYAKFIIRYNPDMEIVNELEVEVDNLEIEVELKTLEDECYIVELNKMKGENVEFFGIYDELLTYLKTMESKGKKLA